MDDQKQSPSPSSFRMSKFGMNLVVRMYLTAPFFRASAKEVASIMMFCKPMRCSEMAQHPYNNGMQSKEVKESAPSLHTCLACADSSSPRAHSCDVPCFTLLHPHLHRDEHLRLIRSPYQSTWLPPLLSTVCCFTITPSASKSPHALFSDVPLPHTSSAYSYGHAQVFSDVPVFSPPYQHVI
jgi:hypothetical protein